MDLKLSRERYIERASKEEREWRNVVIITAQNKQHSQKNQQKIVENWKSILAISKRTNKTTKEINMEHNWSITHAFI